MSYTVRNIRSNRSSLNDPFIWWCIAFLAGAWLLSSAVSTNVIELNPWLNDICTFTTSWMPWVLKSSESFVNFTEVALLVLSVLWITLPIQIGIVTWLTSKSLILHAEIIPWLQKYPFRFPIGVLFVDVILFYLLLTLNAVDIERLSGWRAFLFSYMSVHQGFFGIGIGLMFLSCSFLSAIFSKSVYHIFFDIRRKKQGE